MAGEADHRGEIHAENLRAQGVVKAAPPRAAIEQAKILASLERAQEEADAALRKAHEELERAKRRFDSSRKLLLEAVERENGWGKAYVVEIQRWEDGQPVKDATYEKRAIVVEKDEHPRDGTIHRVLILDAEGEV